MGKVLCYFSKYHDFGHANAVPAYHFLPIYSDLQPGTARCSRLFFVPACRRNSGNFCGEGECRSLIISCKNSKNSEGPMRFAVGGRSVDGRPTVFACERICYFMVCQGCAGGPRSDCLTVPVVGAIVLFVFMCLRGTAGQPLWPRACAIVRSRCSGGLFHLGDAPPSKSTLRFNATVRPSTPRGAAPN